MLTHFGNGLVDIFKSGFKNGEVAAVKYPPNPSDLSSEVTKISSEITRLGASGKAACAIRLRSGLAGAGERPRRAGGARGAGARAMDRTERLRSKWPGF